MRPNFVFEEPYIRRFPGADFHFLCVDIDDLDLHVDDDNRLVKPLVVLQSWPNIPTGRLYVNYSTSIGGRSTFIGGRSTFVGGVGLLL